MPERGAPENEILVVGDLHGRFDSEDIAFLEGRRARLAIFVGDLGDENPKMTRLVAGTRCDKIVLLGNHDAWESFRHDEITPALAESLEVLGDTHFAYGLRDLPELGLSLVGARPFSWGGPSLRSKPVYARLYEVESMEDSARRIVAAAERAAFRNVVIVAHNGPTGLGKRPNSIYGKDFGRPGGDWGDRDLKLAIDRLKRDGFRVPLVVAGHMHHRVSPGHKERERVVTRDGTVYYNPARVPRIFQGADGRVVRHYGIIRCDGGRLVDLREVYRSLDRIEEVALGGAEASQG